MVFDNAAARPAEPPRTSRDASIFALRDEPEGLQVGPELSLEDLVMDIRPAAAADAPDHQADRQAVGDPARAIDAPGLAPA